MLDALFQACNVAVLPPWALLVVAPSHRLTRAVVHGPGPALLLAALYGLLLATMEGPAGGGFGSLDGVAALLGSRQGALVGWIHYLVFDLFVGAWEVRDAQRLGIHHGFVVPCLVLSLMLGPLGLASYLLVRWWRTKRFALHETTP